MINIRSIKVIYNPELISFFNDKSNRFNSHRANQAYLSKYFPDVLNNIRNQYNLDDCIDDDLFLELCYRIYHNITEIPHCIVCGKLMPFISNLGYSELFCGDECRKSPDGQKIITEKRAKTKLERYNDSNYTNRDKIKNSNMSVFEKKIESLIYDTESLKDYLSNNYMIQLSRYCNKFPDSKISKIIIDATPFISNITENDINEGECLDDYKTTQYRLNSLRLDFNKEIRCSICNKVLSLEMIRRELGDKSPLDRLVCSKECQKKQMQNKKDATKFKKHSNDVDRIITTKEELYEFIQNDKQFYKVEHFISKRPDSHLNKILNEVTSYLDEITIDDIRDGCIEDYKTPKYRLYIYKFFKDKLYRCPICGKLIQVEKFNKCLRRKKNGKIEKFVCSSECSKKMLELKKEEQRPKTMIYDLVHDVESLYNYLDSKGSAINTTVIYCNSNPDSLIAKIVIGATSYLDTITKNDIRDEESLEDYKSFSYRVTWLLYLRNEVYRCPVCGKLLPLLQLRKLKDRNNVINEVVCSRECYMKLDVKDETRLKMSEKMKSRWERMSPKEKEAYIKKIGDSNELVYGTRCTLNAPENIEKKQATWMENLGVDWPSKSKKVQDKIAETNIERYGSICALNGPEQIKMKKATWMENLGVDWPSKSSEVVKKALETKLENNGGEFQTQEQMERIIYTMDKNVIENNKHHYTKPYVFKYPNIDRTVVLQGYEQLAIENVLINMYNEEDIYAGGSFMLDNKYIFEYYETTGRKRRYIPDIYISSNNSFIEVKSTYTLISQLDNNILKLKSVIDAGYDIKVIVIEAVHYKKNKIYRGHHFYTLDDLIEKQKEMNNER